jgi:hypothetical protein
MTDSLAGELAALARGLINAIGPGFAADGMRVSVGFGVIHKEGFRARSLWGNRQTAHSFYIDLIECASVLEVRFRRDDPATESFIDRE